MVNKVTVTPMNSVFGAWFPLLLRQKLKEFQVKLPKPTLLVLRTAWFIKPGHQFVKVAGCELLECLRQFLSLPNPAASAWSPQVYCP